MSETTHSKVLVLFTIAILIVTIGAFFFFNYIHAPTVVHLETEGQPSLGYPRAPVRVVIFEEPKCPQCKQFTTLIFPELKKEFIDTNKIEYIVIPVSFLPNSMPAAIAWLCVFNQEKDYSERGLFFKYMDYMYAHQPSESDDWVTLEILEKYAKEVSPAIHLDILKNCINKQTYRKQIEKNTDYGMKVMNGELSTPTLYVDGVMVEEISFSSLSHMIHEALRKKGVRS
jgi:protein-disulfide isomerase